MIIKVMTAQLLLILIPDLLPYGFLPPQCCGREHLDEETSCIGKFFTYFLRLVDALP